MGQPAQDGQGSEILENIQVSEGYADKTLNDKMCNDNFFFFASGVFIGGPVSPLLRFYCIFHYSIHFTLEWSPIQVLTMAQVA